MGLSQLHSARERQLRSLCADLGRRLRAGEACRVEVYLEQHPHLADDEEAVVELIYAEYVVREELGEPSAAEEWYVRFPRWRDRLERLLKFHRMLEEQEAGRSVHPGESLSHGASGDVHSPMAENPGLSSLGPYELLEEIGRGGMGVVYKARQPALNRTVAVKVILAGGLAAPRERERLRFEAEAVARLQHPNIVQVYEFVELDEGPSIVLEYIDGCSLAAFSKQSERRVEWSARLIETLARAIEHAHRRGIVHRDLTPANVLIATDGTPKITDFGLAKSLDQEGAATVSGVLQGTPRYMAPEQVEGRSREVGRLVDLYALGVILYELLTGVTPFRGDTPLETMRKVMEEVPVSPTRLRSDVPADLETICLKCLERDPKRRYESAEALAEDLRRFRMGEPVRARPASRTRRMVKWARRRPAEASLAVLTALVVVVVLVGGFWWNAWLRRHSAMLEAILSRERGSAATARQARARAEEQETIARRHWYGSQLKLAQQAWEAGQIELAQELLANERLVPGGTGLLSFEWSYLHRLCTRDYSLLWGHTNAVASLAVSRNGRTLASRDFDGLLYLHDLATGQMRTAAGRAVPTFFQVAGGRGDRTLSPSLGVFAPVAVREAPSGRDWSEPRGVTEEVKLLGFDRSGSTLLVWDQTEPAPAGSRSRSGTTKATRSGPTPQAELPTALAYTPVGHLVAVGRRDGRLSLCDAATGRERGVFQGTTETIHALGFSRDGTRLAASVGEHGSAVWDVGSGCLLRTCLDHAHQVTRVALSPDGHRLAVREGMWDVMLLDVATGQRQKVQVEASGKWVLGIEFSPDGRGLAVGGEGVHPRICDATTGAVLSRFPAEIGMVRDLSFTPDGQRLVLGAEDSRIRVWHLKPSAAAVSLPGHKQETWALAFSPDGKTLVSGSDDNSIALWDLASRQRRSTLLGHSATVSALAFSPNGRILAAVDLAYNVKLWDVEQGRELATLTGHVKRVRAVAFAPDGKTVASTGSDQTIRLWDVASRACRLVLRGHIDTVRALAYSPDGRTLASAGNDRRVILHDSRGGPARRIWQMASEVTSLAYSSDGQRLAVGGEDRRVTIWDVATGRLRTTLHGHVGRVLTVDFSPDGKTLVSAGEDRAVRLWDPLTGQERLTLRGHKAKLNAVVFSPNGRVLASASHDGAIRLWQARE